MRCGSPLLLAQARERILFGRDEISNYPGFGTKGLMYSFKIIVFS